MFTNPRWRWWVAMIVGMAWMTEGIAAAQNVKTSEKTAAAEKNAVPSVAAPKVVVPFDFISEYDGGVNGAKVAELIWSRIGKQPGFVVPETVQDVRDTLQINGMRLTPMTTTDEYGKLVLDVFDAQIGIWGSMEPAPGAKTDEYDLTIHCVDFSESLPKVVYEIAVRTQTVSEIPHTYVVEMLKRLTDGAYTVADRTSLLYASGKEVERRWEESPNLLGATGFDRVTRGVSDGWENVCGQLREPLGKLVRVVKESGQSFVRFEFTAEVGDNEGCLYYSKPFPVEEGAVYRFQCRYRTSGPAVKVFIKCYDEVATEYAAEEELKTAGSKTAKSTGKGDAAGRADGSDARSTASGRRPGTQGSQGVQYREVYRSQQNLGAEKDGSTGDGWFVHTEDFTPKHTKYTPRIGRVMLYAYLGAGTVDWDDVVVKKIVDAPTDARKDSLRHSLESGVTLDDQESADRASR